MPCLERRRCERKHEKGLAQAEEQNALAPGEERAASRRVYQAAVDGFQALPTAPSYRSERERTTVARPDDVSDGPAGA